MLRDRPRTMRQPSSKEIDQAVKCLRKGKVIGYPTEFIYGLGCDPFNLDAVSQILQIKHRPIDKGFILIASQYQQIEPLIEPIAPPMLTTVLSTWPGPTTWIFPAKPEVPHWIRGSHKTVAVRVSNQPVVKMICEQFGRPIVSTSANIEGQPPITNFRIMQINFSKSLCAILSGQTFHSGETPPKPTQILDAMTGEIIRPGSTES